MIAVQTNLLTLLEGKKQFLIPIYQRTYSWTDKQCRQLWDDIVRAAQDPKTPAHFIGSVVYIKASLYDTPVTSIPQMLVIDGQQRLTTLTLLLLAVREAISTSPVNGEVAADEISDYLVNKHKQDDTRHKLILTQSDKSTLQALIDNLPVPKAHSFRIMSNFRFFQSRINTSGISLDTVYHGINKLMLVDVSLDRNYDNPQLIFESLNSTGLDLSQADLIRNFVLMGQEPARQSALYSNYWFPMESRFGTSGNADLFDRFMRDYLTIKLRRIPNIREVYAEFKSYVQRLSDTSMEDIVTDVAKYSEHFIKIAFNRSDDDQINDVIKDINTLSVDVAYPFLMEAYDDYSEGRISGPTFVQVLKLIESYVFRRAICSVPTNTLNTTFATLYKEVQIEDYIKSIEQALMRRRSHRRLPRDEEFRGQLIIRDVYNMRNRNYLLAKLENWGRKEVVNVNEYTIEHIMPQSEDLADEWINDLGPDWKRVHEVYLHTLGNITLTGYNSEYSNRPFSEKRDYNNGTECGFKHSPLHLNDTLRILSSWNEHEIIRRAESLADKAIEIWRCPSALQQVLNEGDGPGIAISAARDGYFGGWTPIFEQLRARLLERNPKLTEWYKKDYMGYHMADKWIFCINPQDKHMRFDFNAKYSSLLDPLGVAFDAATKYQGGWTTNRTIAYVKSDDNLDELLEIVQQVIDAPSEGGEAGGHGDVRTSKYTYEKDAEQFFKGYLGLYDDLRRRMFDLDIDIREVFKSGWVIFKKGENGVVTKNDNWLLTVNPQKSRIVIFLMIPYSELNDPMGTGFSAEIIRPNAVWARSTTATYLQNEAQLGAVIEFVQQVLERLPKNS